MSHSNTTPNWKIPQFSSNDVPSWLGDVNQIGQKVEQGLNAVKIIGQDANTAASGAQATANALTPRVAANEQGIEGLQTIVGGIETQVDGLDGRVTALEDVGGDDGWEEVTLTLVSGKLPSPGTLKCYCNKKMQLFSVDCNGLFIDVAGKTSLFNTDKFVGASTTTVVGIATDSPGGSATEDTGPCVCSINETGQLRVYFQLIPGTSKTTAHCTVGGVGVIPTASFL